jgi:ABC-type multidrug transport system fused ATPase/permease subunit
MSMFDGLKQSVFMRCLAILPKADRKKLIAISVIQVLMGVLDLVGVIAVGLLGALSVSGLQSQEPGGRIEEILVLLGISSMEFQAQAIFLSLLALFLLVGRTILSMFFTRRILFFLSRRGAMISSELVSRLLAQPLLTIQSQTSQHSLFAVTNGVMLITLQVLATTVVLLADISLLLIMGIGLFVIDPFTSIGTFAIFTMIGLLLYRYLNLRAKDLGLLNSNLTIQSNEKIIEVLSTYRESVVKDRRDYYAHEIGKIRFNLADASAQLGIMPYLSKYIIESTIIVGALLIGAFQFVYEDTAKAVATIAIFLAAGTRIAPAVLRVQQSSLQIRSSMGAANPTLELIETLGNAPIEKVVHSDLDLHHLGFVPEVSAKDLSLTYPGSTQAAIRDVSLNIPAGTSVAIVGPSGAGKTTLIDVLLGVLVPDTGTIELSGASPSTAVRKWPGAIAYVPQDVAIVSGTIRENVALGYPLNLATDELVLNAIKVAQLDNVVSELPFGIDTQVGERGSKLSGGQRQRLGIARAMFTAPKLLVLDEATSALDGETEASISKSIELMRGQITVILIAHRLSTVRNADQVVYMADGHVKAVGKFDSVRKAVQDFDHQAKLMGL